ncbi:MAG: LysM peptidoglycan-binding domain-containing protein [Sphingobacteriales bacterium]|nr:MAG: LysM peptidoglycan-binding domain-containing protein [Sphingobacteriales bacterium]
MIKKICILLLFTCFLTSCASKKYAYHKKNIEGNRQTNPGNSTVNQGPSGLKTTTLDYINKYKAIAIREMNTYGIPASITLAQGILESGSGNSNLAINANNHFGVKCNSNWTGNTYFKDDDKQNECFRAYDNAEQSFIDHSVFLKKPRYAQLFNLDKSDYKGWAYGLKQCGYATNPQYPQLLISYIEKYNLQSFDNPNTIMDPIISPDNTPNNSVITPNNPIPALQANQYIVQKGDTLYNLSKRFLLSVDELIALNNLPDNAIKLGQILIVKK